MRREGALEAATEVEAEVPETEWRVETGKVGWQVDRGEDRGREAEKTGKAQVLRLLCGISL